MLIYKHHTAILRCYVYVGYEIGDVFEKLNDDENCRVVILSGEGKAFSSGLDIKDPWLMQSVMVQEGEDVARKARLLRRKILQMQQSFTNIEKCCKPVIAAVHGICLGGAIDIISACDIRHCTKDSVFSVKEVDVGLAADVGSLNRLPKICGNESWLKEVRYRSYAFGISSPMIISISMNRIGNLRKSLFLCLSNLKCSDYSLESNTFLIHYEGMLRKVSLSARNFNADEALRFGHLASVALIDKYSDLVNRVHDSFDDMMKGVAALAQTIAEKSPVAVQGTKVVLNYSRDHTVNEGLNFVVSVLSSS
ncbi:unnamed protein product [Nippostrongylus brasiliensis]|uniref:Delta(3,5)-Delta(2,4)-dienoyl-CoA isomerase, mitochondrial n=1 Tax=Nippostrongylus brasiliensis TaxID=27835 RepID=A0A0N4XE51_NIPBR|nr:unnamed protein product [Nippostrongylus brasiliensis]